MGHAGPAAGKNGMTLETILLVDDDADIRTIAELALSNVGGWQVVSAASGPDALAKLSEGKTDLVLLDVMMPEMDGPAVLRCLRENERWSEIPVIFMTARVQRSEVEEYLSLGARGVIGKPFDPLDLPEQIRQLVGA